MVTGPRPRGIMSSNAALVIGILLGVFLALAGLFRPFLGLLVFLSIHFVQPGELIPALAPFRLELVYGALLITVLIFRRISGPGPSLLSDRILLGAVLLIGTGALSVPFAVWPGGAVQTVIEMIKLVALVFMLSLLVDSEDRMRKTLWSIVAVAAWFACSSLSAYYRGQFYVLGDLDRAEGVNSMVGGPNELAGLLLALLPLLIALLRITRNSFARIILVTCGVVSLIAISLTGSRIAMIGLIVMAIYYTFQSKYKIPTLVACMVIGCLIWTWLPTPYKTRYLTVEHYAKGGQLDASNEFRLQVWRAGRQIFLEYPILGVGAGQFSNAYGMIYLAGRHSAWMNPHNLLLQVACELGIVGMSVVFYFLWQIAKGIGVVLREKTNSAVEFSYQVGVACSVMYVGVLIISTVSHTMYRPYWYVLAGLVAANRKILYAKLKATSETVPDEFVGTQKVLRRRFAPAPLLSKARR